MLAERYEGKRLNSPNDIVVSSDDAIWFTDPDYGILSDYTGNKAPSEIGRRCVFRIDPKSGNLRSQPTNLANRTAFAFAPDEKTLYVANSSVTHDQQDAHEIVAFDVSAKESYPLAGRLRLSTRAYPMVFGSMSMETSGRARPTASTASRRTAKQSARSSCPRLSPISPSAARSETGCSSPQRPRSTRSMSARAAYERSRRVGSLDLFDIKCIICGGGAMPEFNNLRNRVAVVGVGTTAYGSFPETDEYGLAAEAFRNALDDCKLDKSKIDGLLTCRSSELQPDGRGLRPRPSLDDNLARAWPNVRDRPHRSDDRPGYRTGKLCRAALR